jgi:hypothetical protein
MNSLGDGSGFVGNDVVDVSGVAVGRLAGIVLDETTQGQWGHVELATATPSHTLVPLDDAADDDGSVRLGVDRSTVLGAPRCDPAGTSFPVIPSQWPLYYEMAPPQGPYGPLDGGP